MGLSYHSAMDSLLYKVLRVIVKMEDYYQNNKSAGWMAYIIHYNIRIHNSNVHYMPIYTYGIHMLA